MKLPQREMEFHTSLNKSPEACDCTEQRKPISAWAAKAFEILSAISNYELSRAPDGDPDCTRAGTHLRMNESAQA